MVTLSGPRPDNFCALTFHDGELYGILNGSETSLVRIDTAVGSVTVLGALPDSVDALASPTP